MILWTTHHLLIQTIRNAHHLQEEIHSHSVKTTVLEVELNLGYNIEYNNHISVRAFGIIGGGSALAFLGAASGLSILGSVAGVAGVGAVGVGNKRHPCSTFINF